MFSSSTIKYDDYISKLNEVDDLNNTIDKVKDQSNHQFIK